MTSPFPSSSLRRSSHETGSCVRPSSAGSRSIPGFRIACLPPGNGGCRRPFPFQAMTFQQGFSTTPSLTPGDIRTMQVPSISACGLPNRRFEILSKQIRMCASPKKKNFQIFQVNPGILAFFTNSASPETVRNSSGIWSLKRRRIQFQATLMPTLFPEKAMPY